MQRILALVILLSVAVSGCGLVNSPSDSDLQDYAWAQGFSKEGARLQDGGGRLYLKLNAQCDGELFYYWDDIIFSPNGEYRLEVKKRGELIDTIIEKGIPDFVEKLQAGNVSEKLKGACLER